MGIPYGYHQHGVICIPAMALRAVGRYAYQCLLYSDEYLRVDTMGKERPRQCDYYLRYHPLVFVTAVYYLKPYIKNNFSMQGISLGFHNFLPTEYVDVFTTSIFLIGMWLMAKRKVENWVFWILGDLISVPLYLKKGMLFTSFQYFLFTIIAIMGYREWKQHLRNETAR